MEAASPEPLRGEPRRQLRTAIVYVYTPLKLELRCFGL
jgi:hypothetical protein